MQVVLPGDKSSAQFGLADRRPFDHPAGLKLVVPGWPQWCWSQRDRALVLAGSFLLSLLVGAWAWGTWVGWVFFAFAFFTHVTSITDALRQASFPAFSSRTAAVIVTANLGLLFYSPAALLLSILAWPGVSPQEIGTGYAVNCWAYRNASPRIGDWIWARLQSHGKPHAAQIVATPGQEVEWNGGAWRIDGLPIPLRASPRLTAWPQTCRFHVPSDQVLVEPEEPEAATSAIGQLVLVPAQDIVGRAWARLYPMWDRRLL
jgi:hypothetical protein